jgi:hypothetical protein
LNDLSPPIIEAHEAAKAKEKESEQGEVEPVKPVKRRYVRRTKGPGTLAGKIQKLERKGSKKRFTAEDVLEAMKQTDGNKAAASRILNTDAAYVSILVRRFAKEEPGLEKWVPVARKRKPKTNGPPAPAMDVKVEHTVAVPVGGT